MIKLGDERQRSLKQRLATVWLKREKADVLKDSLTLKDEKIVFCELSGVQKTIYQRLLSLADFKFLRLSRTPCDCGVNQKFFIGYRLLKTRYVITDR
jgi:SNF2 family DNA or RNA helicase